MFWTRWVRGFCAALVISVVGASVYYGKEVMETSGYSKGIGIIAVAVVGSLTLVSLILMISEIAISLNEANKKLDRLCELEAKNLARAQQNFVQPVQPVQQPVYQPAVMPPMPVYPQYQYPQYAAQPQYQPVQPVQSVQQNVQPMQNMQNFTAETEQKESRHSGKSSSWVCLCGNKNSAKAKFCGKCGLPKEL